MESHRLRVALLSLHFAEYVSLLAQALAETCDVLLVLNRENAEREMGNDWGERLRGDSMRVVSLPKVRTPHRVLANTWRAYRELHAFRPDVIHAQEGGIRDELIPVLVGYRGHPIVLTVHDPRPHTGLDARRLRFSRHRLYYALVRRLSTLAITHGDFLCEELTRSDSRFRGKVFPVPHGPLGPMSAGPRRDWVPGNLLFFGRIHEYKGLGDFIAAVEQVAAKGLAVRGVIAGTGADLNNYRARIAGSSLFEVRDGYIPAREMDELFTNTNAVVLPYTDATQSGVAAMALGYGRAVIASRVGAIPELIRDGVNGLLVPPRSPDALAEAIVRIVSDAEFSRRLAHNAHELARGEFSWRSIAAKTVSVYQRAMVMTATRR